MTKVCKFFNIAVLIVLVYCSQCYALNFSKNKKHDTTITSKFIDIKQKSQTIDFIDNVVIKSGPDIMTAQKVVLHYEKSGQSKENNIKNIKAKKDVKIFTSQFVATAELGFYDPNNGTFTLQNDVIVNNGNSIGVGDKFIYNLNTKKGEFVTDGVKNVKSKKDNRVTITIDNEKDK